MKRTVILILILSVILSACQPTPEENAVMQKEDIKNQIEKNSTFENEIFSAPEMWVEKFVAAAGDLTVDINTSISIPPASPLAVSAERTVFTQEFADKFLEYFIGDKSIFEINEQKTKEEIEAEILKYELALERSKENINDEENPEDFYGAIINMLKEDLKNAPESIEDVIVEKKFTIQDPPAYLVADVLKSDNETDEEYEQTVKDNEEYKKMMKAQYNENVTAIKGRVDLGKETQAKVNITNDKTGNNTIADFSNLGKYKSVSETRTSAQEITPNNTDMPLDEAVSIAEDFLIYMGIHDMQLAYAQIGKLNSLSGNKKSDEQCYILNFTKEYNGFNETFEITSGMRSDGFNNFRLYERMFFWINDEGILRFSWTNPISFKETLSENIKLISFGEIQTIFKQQIKNVHLWNDESDVINRIIVIDNITLGLMRVLQPNSEEYLLIPVWDFFGSEIYQYSEDSKTQYILDNNNQIIEKRELVSFLTINAIDGSIIDRQQGY